MTTYLERADEAAGSARDLQGSGDFNGACNRAYYAVFYAALGLLALSRETDVVKTHASVLREFSRQFVKGDAASVDLGKALTTAQNLRSRADYTLSGATAGEASRAIDAMNLLLEFARPFLERKEPSP